MKLIPKCSHNGFDGKNGRSIAVDYEPHKPPELINEREEVLLTFADGTREDQIQRFCDLIDKIYNYGYEKGKVDKLRSIQSELGITPPSFW